MGRRRHSLTGPRYTAADFLTQHQSVLPVLVAAEVSLLPTAVALAGEEPDANAVAALATETTQMK